LIANVDGVSDCSAHVSSDGTNPLRLSTIADETSALQHLDRAL